MDCCGVDDDFVGEGGDGADLVDEVLKGGVVADLCGVRWCILLCSYCGAYRDEDYVAVLYEILW